ncbi:testis-specific protein 10-interacting protein-like [Hypanus sabinus]|uniref:testis-specific protein 10-interacting protein-like n=1 Tax=Hypanus sabinus TaxID=79690 RepID=UPI0028C4CD47|nr:testis-specific protein 10-interacting protein-like [Hypanus sabinus]
MWDGFSVDRYAPRGRPGPPPSAQEGCCLHGPGCRTPRTRPGTAPIPRSRGEQNIRSRQRSSLPEQPRRSGRSGADARHPPRPRVGESGREPPPSDGVAVAKVTGRRPPPGRPKPKSPPEPAAACRQLAEQQHRSALSRAAGGDTTRRLRRAACDGEVKATKLVEQRHERIRKTLMEKERRELMETSRMVNDGLKKRKLGRHIAARICLHQVERYRKSHAGLRLQNLRSRTREQTAQYHAELRAMKERVASAPYLFEQVTQDNIRGTVDRLFSRVLRRLQLDEELVLELRAAGGWGDLEGKSEAGSWDAAARPPTSGDDRCPLLEQPGHECGYADCAGIPDSAARCVCECGQE